MRILSILSIAALVLVLNACEQQPLPGDPHPGKHAAHPAGDGDSHPQPGAAKPEAAKPGEAPKFFPEKK
jgi:hypothetical protein